MKKSTFALFMASIIYAGALFVICISVDATRNKFPLTTSDHAPAPPGNIGTNMDNLNDFVDRDLPAGAMKDAAELGQVRTLIWLINHHDITVPAAAQTIAGRDGQ